MNTPPLLDDKNLSIDQLDPKLIRQVLLTDPSKFDSLHVSNAPRNTPSFEDFSRDEIESTASMEATMKRAFRDHVASQTTTNMKPLADLVLQLHQQLRALVPNRHDLHTAVNDEAVTAAEDVETLLPLLMHASEGLESLESEARAETSAAWRRQAQEETTTTAEFVVTSTMYLLYKTELCQADKQDFYLQHIWAPRIHVEGPKYLRSLFETQFSSDGRYPLTTTWINDLVSQCEGNLESESARRALIRKGWVQTILFRKEQATSIPEILAQEVDSIRLIRHVCARAVAGCALALHAAASNTALLTQRIEPTSPAGLRKADLIQAMSSNNRSASYEDDVSNAVVALAKAWSSSSVSDESSLRNRAVAVLRGEDPVIRLLDHRMQEVFADVVASDVSGTTPVVMRSGVQERSTNNESQEAALVSRSEDVFCGKGLSFYAPELATLSVHARKVIDLAWLVHMDLMETTIRECT